GGKSTLLAELARRGFAVVEEPGRRVVAQEIATGGDALPWIDLPAFLDRVLSLARADLAAARQRDGVVFFDRGLVDALVARAHVAGIPVDPAEIAAEPFDRRVVLAPPWPAIFVTDAERRHGLAEAVAEWQRLKAAWPRLGFTPRELPKTGVAERADWVLRALGVDGGDRRGAPTA
ncbi:MAG: AAA family ATPase, partial [Alphaproteobacteria bacterium]|nr:AAA family ATPase [Alphaproteobacteria bacterium]